MSYAKYILLAALLLFAVSATCLAADSRYENIVIGDSIAAQLDKDTLRYEKDPYRNEKLLNVWIKTPSDFNSDYTFSHYLFRLNSREMLLLDTVDYNSAGQITNKISAPYHPNSWTQILPESLQESCYLSALKYSQANNLKLQQDYDERTAAPKRDAFSILTDVFNIVSNNN